jgi:hypothetical protein
MGIVYSMTTITPDGNNSAAVMIATPAYGSNYHSRYVATLWSLLSEAPKHRISFEFQEIDYCDIVIARNYLISVFYYRYTQCSHILFMDSDMGFEAAAIFDMIRLGEDVVGAIYPKRTIDFRKLHAMGDLPFDEAFARSIEFVGRPLRSLRHHANERFCEAEYCGTGLLLISRQCIARMIQELPEIVDLRGCQSYPWMGKGLKYFLTPFNKVIVDGVELSEDYSFCHRWRHGCQGRIYADTHHPVSHVMRKPLTTSYRHRAFPRLRITVNPEAGSMPPPDSCAPQS